MSELSPLLYFWTVVRAGSIQKAGAELSVSPPAISARLKLKSCFGGRTSARAHGNGRDRVP